MHLPPDPEHILECLEIQGQDLYDNPVMVAEEMGIGHRPIKWSWSKETDCLD